MKRNRLTIEEIQGTSMIENLPAALVAAAFLAAAFLVAAFLVAALHNP